MKVSFPNIIKIDQTNQFKIDWSGLRIRDIPTNYHVVVELKYIATTPICAQYRVDANGTNNIQDNILFLREGEQKYLLMEGQWTPEHQIQCVLQPNSNKSYSTRIKIINDNNEKEILYNNLVPWVDTSTSQKLYIYPQNIRDTVKFTFSTVDTNVFDIYTQVRITVFQDQYECITIRPNGENKYEGIQTYNYKTCRKDGKSKVLIGVKITNTNGELVDLNNNIINGLEYTITSIKYLDYVFDQTNTSINTNVSLIQTNDQIEIHDPASANLERKNKSLFKYNWSDVMPNNSYPKPEYYELFPKLNDSNSLINFNIIKNNHLRKYYLPDEDIGNGGHIVANFARSHNLSCGYPIPIDLSTKNPSNILKWDGTIAQNFSQGSGTQEDPFIINTPEELACAILHDGQTREAIWRSDLINENLSWDGLDSKGLPNWATVPSLYYEINPSIYAFDMNGFKDITLDSNYKDIKQIFDTQFWCEQDWPYIDYTTLWGNEMSANPAYCFTGHLNGNGAIIYNLRVSTSQEACGLIPWTYGGSVSNLMLKYCYFWFHGCYADYGYAPVGGMGAIVGAHHNVANVAKDIININRCAVVNCYMSCYQYHNTIIIAHMIGNLRWHQAEITNCIAINNSLNYYSMSEPLTVGGFIGTYQRWSGTTGKHNDDTHPIIRQSIIIGHNFIPSGQLLQSPLAHLGWELNEDDTYKKDNNGNNIPINPNHQSLLFYRDQEIGWIQRAYTNKRKDYTNSNILGDDRNYCWDDSLERDSILLKDNKVWDNTQNIVWKSVYNNKTQKYEQIPSDIWFPTTITYNLTDFAKYFYIDTGKYKLTANKQFSNINDTIQLSVQPYYYINNEMLIPKIDYSQKVTVTNNTVVYIKSPITSNYVAKNIYVKTNSGDYAKAQKIYIKQKNGSYIQAF